MKTTQCPSCGEIVPTAHHCAACGLELPTPPAWHGRLPSIESYGIDTETLFADRRAASDNDEF